MAKRKRARDEYLRMALSVYTIDEQCREDEHPAWKRVGGTVRGPRGIVNARRLGLSRSRYRASRAPNKALARQRAREALRAGLGGAWR